MIGILSAQTNTGVVGGLDPPIRSDSHRQRGRARSCPIRCTHSTSNHFPRGAVTEWVGRSSRPMTVVGVGMAGHTRSGRKH
jgi:hypothetical protein